MIAMAMGVAPSSFCIAASFLALTPASSTALHMRRSPLQAERCSRELPEGSRQFTRSSLMRMGEGSGVVGLDESASKAATEEEEEEEEEATFFSRSEKEGGRAPPFSGACFWRGLQNEEIEKLFEGDIFKNARETFLSCDEASMTHLHQLNEHNFYFFLFFYDLPSHHQDKK